jgi:DNA-binding CsgD family transcriptional regulator
MTPFVGRVEELVALTEVGERGGAAAAAVVGDPGSGKSRLLVEAAARTASRKQFRVVGYEPEAEVPFASAADFLKALAGAGPRGRSLEAVVFPTAGDRAPLDPLRVFEAAHRVLSTLAPSLVLVDDMQWVDELSLALLHYLVRAALVGEDALIVFAAGRPSRNTTSFTESLAQTLPADGLVQLDLQPLAAEAALALVKTLAPNLSDEAARALAEKSDGSPFWLDALVRSGGDADAARLVTTRLRGTSADAATLLAVLAIAGRPLALADAAEVNAWPEERAGQAVRELSTRGVVVESAGTLSLAHDLIREAAADEIRGEQRLRIHRRIGDWLEQDAGGDIKRLREALGHRHVAGLPCLELATRLARSPQRTLLGDDGLDLLISVADTANPATETTLALNEEIAGLASVLGRHEVALERNLLLANRRRDPVRRAFALLAATRSAFALDEPDRARTYLERAREVDVEEPIPRLELDIEQAVLDLWSEAAKERGRVFAHDTATRARRLFELDSRARQTFLEALRVEYEAAYQEDDPEAMVRAAEERATVAQGFDEDAYLNALLAGARALRRLGRLDEALEQTQAVYDQAQQRVLPRIALDAGYWLGTFLLQSGRVTEADDVVSATAELAARIGDEGRGRHSIERLVSEVEYYRTDWRKGVDRLLAYASRRGEHAGVELHQLAALWIAFVGDPTAADQVVVQLVEARACADAAACPRCATELRLAAADALAHVGRRSDAAESLSEWARLQPRPQPRDQNLRRRVDALVTQRVEVMEGVAHQAEELGFILDALWTRVDLGTALVAGDRARAKEILTAVVERADEGGAHTIAEVAGKRLRSLGVRTWRRGADTGTLTERERAIARLVAEGASNPEIAQQLFLSRKTVERHISNVLRKAGVRNRAELAAKVAELEVEGAHR